MISIVLYGRNDNYGYNLHKRAALSLNCMAEVMTAAADEIIFVDYNTPDDFPTFPEAIFDTLTARARRMLRVLRIRPSVHNSRFASRTHLKALEPISRNAAIRRSNPANKWILSTNTDMIFVPRQGTSLTDLVADLSHGFYCAPRMELPETLWESFDRLNPAGVIAETRALGESAHLNEIVLGADVILYDGPGDFQLMRRSDLFAIHGFHEDMLLGWHLDSNISKRLCLLHTFVGDAAPFVFGYHCDHTRQITPAHAPRSLENSAAEFVDLVDRPDIPAQAASWGLSDIELEEIRLTSAINVGYRQALAQAIERPLTEPSTARYRSESYGLETAAPEHVLPFLLDLFANERRDFRVAWIGPQDRLYGLFASCWDKLGFKNDITPWDCRSTDIVPDVDAFVVNFGIPLLVDEERSEIVVDSFQELALDEYYRVHSGLSPRRIIGVNAIHNRYEALVQKFIGCSKTPFAARLRHGYLLKDAIVEFEDWTELMLAGLAGNKDVAGRVGAGSGAGYVFYGPYVRLSRGIYTIEVTLTRSEPLPDHCKLHLDIALSQQIMTVMEVAFEQDTVTLPMLVEITSERASDSIEVRLHTTGGARVYLDKIVVKRLLRRARECYPNISNIAAAGDPA